ncbi:Co2+/Mg2+ efflux protein ApaG [Aquimarina sp. ERC-38]|uniref:Co2+/Mg2+ efflux protein ApaG n=1 Tax=Aquimarina sp. ERC-38 TaxID=2949996 RepID=UPI0022481B32|nr:Co2+/Mg2+ efflux protein ApaG [Aquimarina sp. ERC-38]UZO82563.1 Co2+/Mg2+ efflux protein ApaG [Aquimarina sp. ERC-38]
MVQQVTKGIKISVATNFEGTFFKNYQLFYAFGYEVTIENQGKNAVQLTSRFWEIYDSLKIKEVVQGDGVIGKKPVLQPGESHTYTSGCLLKSPFGAMKGYYQMVNFATADTFKVTIPVFRLSAPFAIN